MAGADRDESLTKKRNTTTVSNWTFLKNGPDIRLQLVQNMEKEETRCGLRGGGGGGA